jgi:hypothetical protein
MAFPDTSVLDTFNRADDADIHSDNPSSGAPAYAADAVNGAAVTVQIISNEAAGSGSYGSAYINEVKDAAVNGVEVYADISSTPGGASEYIVIWGINAPGSGAWDGYTWSYYHGDTSLYGYEWLNDAPTGFVGSPVDITLADGDGIGIYVGTAGATSCKSRQSGTWTERLTRTDTTYLSGYIGIELSSSTERMDNFGGGQVAAAVTVRPQLLVVRQAVQRATVR